MTNTLKTATLLMEAGISAIPTGPDKRALVKWKDYMTSRPTEAELVSWFSKDAGIAVVGGLVQCVDFDTKYCAGIFAAFCREAEAVGLDFLLGGLIRQRTPSGGYHLVFQCANPIRNLKLASKLNHETMIETRGDGGYFLISPSPGYVLEQGDWSAIPTITEEDREALLDLAKSFDEKATHEEPTPAKTSSPTTSTGELTPGDDFNQRADVPALLRKHGWTCRGGKNWTRPGKSQGVSATWDKIPGKFFVFSSSTPFKPQHPYLPWHIYAVLECGGDYARAASELRRQGFGGVVPKKEKQFDWDNEPPGTEYCDEPPACEGLEPEGYLLKSERPVGEAVTKETEEEKIRRMLGARAFDQSKEPPPIRPVFTLGGVVISTPGNLTAITAQAKMGKSALVSALTAATMTDPNEDTDCLTAVGFNTDGKALIYFDTEQAPDDFWHAVNRAKRRARVSSVPPWLRAYTVADFASTMSRKAVALDMADAAALYGGIYAVIIDGVADLVLDVNDAKECNELVAELHGLSIRYDCAIICVIHKNPGSDKVRGHLGSQIERKAETNLSLDKDGDVTVVWSAKQRRAPIDKATGPKFKWDDELKMHATFLGDAAGPSKDQQKIATLIELAEAIMKPGDVLSWTEVIEALRQARRTPDKTPTQSAAEGWLNKMKAAEVICVMKGRYSLNPKLSIC